MAHIPVLNSGLVCQSRGWLSRATPIEQWTSLSTARIRERCIRAAVTSQTVDSKGPIDGRLWLSSLPSWRTIEDSCAHNLVSEPNVNCRASSGSTGAVVDVEELTKDSEAGLVEVGYIVCTHGVQGELRVHSLTDFPEQRFLTSGTRWLRPRTGDQHLLRRVELLEGRVGPGSPPSWLVTLKNYDTPEKARDVVGNTILARMDEKPSLEEGEFYIPDLMGMTVALRKTGKTIGVIVDMVSAGGGNDLLQVYLTSSTDDTSERKVWIPFVERIVPVVDMKRRMVEIAPPPGLLELNPPSKKLKKRAYTKEIVKETRKLNVKVSGVKKKLKALGQTHILENLAAGTKDERNALIEELLRVDFAVLQHAIKEDDQAGIAAFKQRYIHLNLIC